MRFSIIMPTYNDSNSITETLDSIFNQDYDNFELIIVDDGSTDNTKKIINDYKEKKDKNNKIKYIYQENKDQLNAIKNGCNYITGDYIYILHSDDILNGNDILSKMNKYVMENPNYDAIIADLKIINENSEEIGMQKVKEYKNKKYIIPLQLLFLGRNIFVDFALVKKDIFINQMYKNYLTWNGPFWLDCDEASTLNVKKVDFPFEKYRVFSENYINNELGLINVFNGEVRVITSLMKKFTIPFYKLQYYFYQLASRLKMNYRPIYFKKETKNKYNILKFVYSKRLNLNDIKKYPFYEAIINFYKNYTERTISINIPKKIYLGSDMREFNKKMLNKKLEKEYYELFKEMNNGFNKVIVKKCNEENIKNILKFMCIDKFVEVEVK